MGEEGLSRVDKTEDEVEKGPTDRMTMTVAWKKLTNLRASEVTQPLPSLDSLPR